MNGFAVQVEEIGERRSAGRPPATPLGVSSWNTGAVAALEVADERASARRPSRCQLMYGTLPENVMSGCVESLTVFEIGWPLLNSSKWSPPPGARRRSRACRRRSSSSHATHGAVVPPGVSVPAATRGSSALRSGARFRRRRVLGVGSAQAEAVVPAGVEHVGLPGGAVADGDPLEAAGARWRRRRPWRRTPARCGAGRCGSGPARTRRPTARCRPGR